MELEIATLIYKDRAVWSDLKVKPFIQEVKCVADFDENGRQEEYTSYRVGIENLEGKTVGAIELSYEDDGSQSYRLDMESGVDPKTVVSIETLSEMHKALFRACYRYHDLITADFEVIKGLICVNRQPVKLPRIPVGF